MAATVSDGSTPSYQWFKGSQALSGKTSATLTISPSATTDSGSYTVKVSATGAQVVTSTAATVTVNAAAVVPVITAGTAPANFKVGDADIDLSTLFSITPAGTAMTYTSGTTANATIVSGNKLHAVKAGDSVITAKANGAADKTLTVNVKAAPVVVPTVTNDGSPIVGTVGTPVTMKAKSSDSAATIAYTIKSAGTTAAGAAVVSGTGVLTVTGAGDAIVTATGSTGGSVDLPKVVFTAAAPAKAVDGKVIPAGKKGGDVVAPADLFAVSNGAALTDVKTVAVVPTSAGTWDDTTGLTIDAAATGDITLTYTVSAGVTKGSTVPKVTGVVAP